MKRLELRPAARSDLAAIRRYTMERWNEDQADKYLTTIDAVLERLVTDGPHSQAAVIGGYRRQRAGSHVVFYREDADLVTIVRILHKRMDPGRHLPR